MSPKRRTWASPVTLEKALRFHESLAKKVKAEESVSADGSGLSKARQNLANNEQRIRDMLEHVLTKTFAGGRVRCSKAENARKLRCLYIEAIRRGILAPRICHEILDKACDEVLCLAVQTNNDVFVNDAVESLIKRHRRSIEAFKRKQFGLSPDEIEVRSYEAVWRSARLFNPSHKSKAKFSTHLFRWLNRNARARTKGDKGDFLLARQEGIVVISANRQDNSGDSIDLFDSIGLQREGSSEPRIDRSRVKKIRGALKSVGERQKKVIELHFYKNFSIERASVEIGCSVAEVVKDIESALESMRATLVCPSL